MNRVLIVVTLCATMLLALAIMVTHDLHVQEYEQAFIGSILDILKRLF